MNFNVFSYYFSFVLIFCFLTIVQSQNLALNKPYTFSVKPNYKMSKSISDITDLTDGQYVEGRLWSKKASVTWRKKKTIRIQIDLKSVEPINRIKFSTAGGTANVNFPQNLYIFLSEDGSYFEYMGDAADVTNKKYSGYERRIFSLNDIDRKARYVMVYGIPQGNYFTADEIEVLKSSKLELEPAAKDISQLLIDKKVKQIKYESHQKKANTIFKEKIELQGFIKNLEELKHNKIDYSKDSLRIILGENLAQKFKTNYIVTKINLWDEIDPFFIPDENPDYSYFELEIPQGAHQYGGFILTNLQSDSDRFSLKASDSLIKIFELPFVDFRDGLKFADPLIPLKDSIQIPFGAFKVFLFKRKGQQTGKFNEKITISNGKKVIDLDVFSNIKRIFDLEKGFSLNANVWPYLQKKGFQGSQKSAVENLLEHHINTAVLNYGRLPEVHSNNFTKTKNYLKNYTEIDKILLFVNYRHDNRRNGFEGGVFLSDEWKEYFKIWYGEILKVVKEIHPKAEVYFYPFDEIKGKEEVQYYIDLAYWAKRSIPNFKLYVTVEHKEELIQILPFSDIIQLNLGGKNLPIIDDLPSHEAEIWGYENKSEALSNSPYEFYRMKAWRAYAEKRTGVGFWIYLYDTKIYPDDFFVNHFNRFEVVYNYKNSIISSRRWEGFSAGIEDYEVIKSYEKKFGRIKTLQLVNQVLSDVKNAKRADGIIQYMVKQL